MNQINNMKNTIYSLFLLLLSILPAHASGDKPTIKSLLKELDRTIAMKADFHKQREHEIDSIRKLAHATPSPEEKYHLYSSLYGIYLHYQADSALHYLEKRKGRSYRSKCGSESESPAANLFVSGKGIQAAASRRDDPPSEKFETAVSHSCRFAVRGFSP